MRRVLVSRRRRGANPWWRALIVTSLLAGQAGARVRHALYAAFPGIQNHYPDNNYNLK